MHGEGQMFYQDGTIYQGSYEKDVKHGSGCFSWPNGDKIEGHWVNGKQYG